MNIKKHVLVVLFLAMFCSAGLAQTSFEQGIGTYNDQVRSVCLDNNTLQNSVTVLRCIGPTCNLINSSATHFCQYGCSSRDVPNSCNPSPQQANWTIGVMVVLIILGLVAAFWWLAKKR
jgi:hypothetical protein